MRYAKWLSLFTALVLILSACTNTPRKNTAPQQQARAEALQAMPDWRLRGKLGFKVPGQAGSAFIDWKQNGEGFRIHLSGPLGQGATTIENDGQTLSLRQDGKLVQNPDLQQDLIQQQLGWQLPTQQLRYWVLGLSAPGSKADSLYDKKTGLLSSLLQDQWDISYQRYTRHRLPLPEKIILRRQDTKLTLIIKRWN